MKNIIIIIFFLAPSYLVAQYHEICFTSIGCDAVDGFYVDVSYTIFGNDQLSLRLVCDYRESSRGNVRSLPFAATFQGTGTKRITIAAISCNQVSLLNQISIKYFDVGSTIPNFSFDFLNGSCLNNNCCMSIFGSGNCDLSIATTVQHQTCTSMGSATANVTAGTPPFIYNWSNGATTSTASLNAGTHSVTVTDALDCIAIQSNIVIEDRNLYITQVNQARPCDRFGDVSLTLSGGTAPITYLWSSGATTSVLQPTTDDRPYSVTVTDANGCQATRSSISIPTFLSVNTTTSEPYTCSSKGAVSIIPSGGTLPYTYQWSTGSTESILRNLEAGTYSGTVTDAAGCTVTRSIVVENQCICNNLSAITTIEPANCGTLGKISVDVLGGTFPYTYQWSTGVGSAMSFQNVRSGTYAVIVVDAAGCSVVKSNLIVENICPNTVCFNSVYFDTRQVANPNIPNSVTDQILYADIRFDRASALNLSIQWSILTPGMTTDPNPTTTQLQLNPGSTNIRLFISGYASTGPPLSTSTTRIRANFFVVPNNPFTARQYDFVNGLCINPDGCCIGKTRPPCSLSATTNVIAGSCIKNSTIEAIAANGVVPYQYRWSTGATTSRIDVPEGSYTVTVTDASGYCSITKSVAVANPCPLDCAKYIDNCREDWEQFILKNYAGAKCKQWDTQCDWLSDIRRDGKVAIGVDLTAVPDGYNLAVQGRVIAKEVKVKLCETGWCDYVFENNYKLMPLIDVNRYIHQNKRLPTMPSTAEIDKEGGYKLKELTVKQQEKIEEAYLHLIALEEKVKKLQTRVDEKKQQNKKIAQMLKK